MIKRKGDRSMRKFEIKNSIIGINFVFNDIKVQFSQCEDVSVVCFENDFSEEKYYIKLLNEKWVKNVILIGAKTKIDFGKKLILADCVNKKFFKSSKRVMFIINTDIDEDVLTSLVQLFNVSQKLGLKIGTDKIIGYSYKQTRELEKSLEALLQENLYDRYKVVYEYICDELDKKFSDNSICQFENDRCIANRKHKNKSKIMGCCYSFKYKFGTFYDVKLCEHQKDKKCEVKCLGCKLFTCQYLKKHGIKFALADMPIALAFFNKKQREILRTTFFVPEEEVLKAILK